MMDKQLSILMGKQVKSKPLKTYDFCNNINGNKMINLSRQLSWSLTHMELVTPLENFYVTKPSVLGSNGHLSQKLVLL